MTAISKDSKICVLGGGAWGTALANSLALRDGQVLQWCRSQETVDEINNSCTNSKYLGEIILSENLLATTDIASACKADILLCVTPAQSFAALATQIVHNASADRHVVLCAKGIDQASGKLLHEIALEHFDPKNISVLSGPSFAHDVARGLPTAISCASASMTIAHSLATRVSSPTLRLYASDDVTGVEAGGALKNIMALAVGAARGLELGASAEAALIARGFAEMQRLAVAMGGRAETLTGLSGLGDLVLTCSSPQSRNFAYGIALAKNTVSPSMPLAEGVHSAQQAVHLAARHAIDAPILATVKAVLDKDITAQQAVEKLLSRPLRGETTS